MKKKFDKLFKKLPKINSASVLLNMDWYSVDGEDWHIRDFGKTHSPDSTTCSEVSLTYDDTRRRELG